MATLIFDSLTDHSALDNTNTPILGAAVDLNPQIVSKILDGTTQTDLATDAAFDIRFTQSRVGARFINLDNAAAAVGDAITIEWDPADNAQMTDNSSGVGIAFKMPDSSDNQDVFARLTSICRIDTAGSEDGEFGFNVAWGAHATGGTVVEIATLNINSGAATLTLLTPEPTVVDGNVLGRIDFQAPLETGADALLVAASIWAEADDTFSATLNDTDLVFAVAESETALERMRLSYDGTNVGLTFSGATTISGGAFAISNPITVTDTTAPLILQYDSGEYVTHAVSSAGVYSITTTDDSSDSGAVTIDTVDSITLDSDTATEGVVYADGGTDMLRIFNSSSDVILKPLVNGKDLVIQQDDGNEVARFGNDRKFYLYDEGGEYLVSNGTALTIASGGVAWELPVADGSDGEVLETDGSGNLDWVAQTSGATLTGSTNNTVTTVTGSNAFQGEAELTFDGTDLAIGNAAPSSYINSVHGIIVGDTSDATAEIVIATSTSGIGELNFTDTANTTNQAHIRYDHSNSYMVLNAGGGDNIFHTGSGLVGIRESVHTGMTTGLTINQGGSDNIAFSIKSSDINLNGDPGGWGAEADDYMIVRKSGVNGGMVLNGYREDENAQQVVFLGAFGGQASDTQSTAAAALFDVFISEHATDGSLSNMTADGVMFGVRGKDNAGNIHSKFIVDEDGDIKYDGSDGGAFDVREELGGVVNDNQLLRAYTLEYSKTETIRRSKWDDMIRYNRDDLMASGVLSYCSPEDAALGHHSMVSVGGTTRLLVGATWQNHVEIQEIKEAYESRIAALEMQVTNLLEN